MSKKPVGSHNVGGERESSPKRLSNFGLNPFALEMLVKSYIEKASPQPFKASISIGYEDKIKNKVGRRVDIYLLTPGYLGKHRADPRVIDDTALRLFVQSYYHDLFPLPTSFLYHGIEVHLRSPDHNEFDRKNPMAQLFDPTKKE